MGDPSAPVEGKAKRGLTDKWEGLLSDSQKESIHDIQIACGELPLPDKFTSPSVVHHPLDAPDGQTGTGTVRQDSLSFGPPTTPSRLKLSVPRLSIADGLSFPDPSSPLGNAPPPTPAFDAPPLLGNGAHAHSVLQGGPIAATPIENTQQFLSWFADIHEEMEKGQEDIHRSHLATLHLYLSTCTSILSHLSNTGTLLSNLSSEYTSVQSKTHALQQACERLLEEQTELAEVEAEIRERLAYFDDLENVARQLAMSGDIFKGPAFGYGGGASRSNQGSRRSTILVADSVAIAGEKDPTGSRTSLPGSPMVGPVGTGSGPGSGTEGGVQGFLTMLARLDECLAFMEGHPKYLDADLYRLRFRQLLTRAMSLIRLQFISDVDRLAVESAASTTATPAGSSSSLQGGGGGGEQEGGKEATRSDIQSFVRFRTAAVRLRPLLSELETRAPGNREYLALLRECFQSYFAARRAAAKPAMRAALAEMERAGGPGGRGTVAGTGTGTGTGTVAGRRASMVGVAGSGDLVGMARTGFAYISNMCSEEYSLFGQFFSVGGAELSNFLDSLTSPICDSLRALVIHEPRIDHLSDLCLLLTSIASGPSANVRADGSSSEENGFRDGEDEEGRGAVREAAMRVLEDAQARLSFRAQEYIRKEIEAYEPKEAELEVFVKARKFTSGASLPMLPAATTSAILSAPMAQSPTKAAPATIPVEEEHVAKEIRAREDKRTFEEMGEPGKVVERQSSSTGFVGVGGKMLVYGGGESYPTVQRTLYVLGKLYRCVNNAVFEDIAQEAVDLCRKSLVAAAEMLARKSKQDSQLFLIKNLLILREQTIPFDTSFIRREEHVDLGSVRDALMMLLDPQTFISFGANIKVVQSYTDARENLDQELKRFSEAFVMETTSSCVESLQSFMSKASAFNLRAQNATHCVGQLKDQIYAQPVHVLQAYEAFNAALSERLLVSVQRLDEMLGDKKTESVVVRVIKNSILDTYRSFYGVVQAEYKDEPLLGGKLATPLEMEENIIRLTGGIEGTGLTQSFVGEGPVRNTARQSFGGDSGAKRLSLAADGFQVVR